MALLIVNLDQQIGSQQEWIDTVASQLPGMALRLWPDIGDPADIEYLAFVRPDFGVLPPLPNLKAMFSRSAGVDGFINHPKIPKVPLGKVEPSRGDPMMTEYVVMHVLRLHRDMPRYQQAQAFTSNSSDFSTSAGALAIMPNPRNPTRRCSGRTIGTTSRYQSFSAWAC